MKFAYADPPYVGQGHRYPEKVETNHEVLIGTLCAEYPDGWALSASSPSLYRIERILNETFGLDAMKGDYRIGSWVKPFAVFKPNVNPAYAWEPVIFRGGRGHTREDMTIRDWVSASITLQRGVVGAKPRDFCFWIFRLLNVQPGDTFDDIFPGSGAVSRSLVEWFSQPRQAVLA